VRRFILLLHLHQAHHLIHIRSSNWLCYHGNRHSRSRVHKRRNSFVLANKRRIHSFVPFKHPQQVASFLLIPYPIGHVPMFTDRALGITVGYTFWYLLCMTATAEVVAASDLITFCMSTLFHYYMLFPYD